MKKGQDEGVMRACSGSSVMWRGWRMIGLKESLCRSVCWLSFSVCVQKKWIDTVKDFLKKRGLDARQARRMVQNRC